MRVTDLQPTNTTAINEVATILVEAFAANFWILTSNVS